MTARLTGLSLPAQIRGWIVALDTGATPRLRATVTDGPTPIYDRLQRRYFPPRDARGRFSRRPT